MSKAKLAFYASPQKIKQLGLIHNSSERREIL